MKTILFDNYDDLLHKRFKSLRNAFKRITSVYNII